MIKSTFLGAALIRITGTYEQISAVGETVNAFVPAPLPPRKPPLKMDAELSELLRRTEAAVEKLELAGGMVPDVALIGLEGIEAVVRQPKGSLLARASTTSATILLSKN